MNHLFSPEWSWRYLVEVITATHVPLSCILVFLMPIQFLSVKGSPFHLALGKWHVRISLLVGAVTLAVSPIYLLYYKSFEDEPTPWRDGKFLLLQFAMNPIIVFSLTLVNAVEAIRRKRRGLRTIGWTIILTNTVLITVMAVFTMDVVMQHHPLLGGWGALEMSTQLLVLAALAYFLHSPHPEAIPIAWLYFHGVNFALQALMILTSLFGGVPATGVAIFYPFLFRYIAIFNYCMIPTTITIPLIMTYSAWKKLRMPASSHLEPPNLGVIQGSGG
jgi:hypothetical protein